jgi:hypothetical protein
LHPNWHLSAQDNNSHSKTAEGALRKTGERQIKVFQRKRHLEPNWGIIVESVGAARSHKNGPGIKEKAINAEIYCNSRV